MEDFVTVDLHQEQVAERCIASPAVQPKSSPSRVLVSLKGKDVTLVPKAESALEVNQKKTPTKTLPKAKESPIAKENIDTELCHRIDLSHQDETTTDSPAATAKEHAEGTTLPEPEQSHVNQLAIQLQVLAVRVRAQHVSFSRFQLLLLIMLFFSSALLLKHSNWHSHH